MRQSGWAGAVPSQAAVSSSFEIPGMQYQMTLPDPRVNQVAGYAFSQGLLSSSEQLGSQQRTAAAMPVATGFSPSNGMHAHTSLPSAPPSQVRGQVLTGADESRLAAMRAKNREAQQRFRDRQRAKQMEAEEQLQNLQLERDRLLAENQALGKQVRWRLVPLSAFVDGRLVLVQTLIHCFYVLLLVQNVAMEKVLAVRDSLLDAFQQTAHCTRDRPGGARALPSAVDREEAYEKVKGLVDAVNNLSPEGTDAETLTAARAVGWRDASSEPSAVGAAASNEPFSAQSDLSDKQEIIPTMRSLAELKEKWLAEAIDGKMLGLQTNIPAPSDPVLVQRISSMHEARELFDYWRRATVDLSSAYEAAEAVQFDEESRQHVEKAMRSLLSIWWHAAHLKPLHLLNLTATFLPQGSSQQERWAQIAVRYA